MPVIVPSPPPEDRAIEARVRLLRDGLLNCLAPLMSGIAGILLVPLMLHRLGAEPYGLLVAAATLAGMLASVDFGLEVSLTRAVAMSPSGRDDSDGVRFARMAGSLYLFLGAAGGILVVMTGWLLDDGLKLSSGTRDAAAMVFVSAGLSFFADRVTAWGVGVLAGLRRFGATNALSVAGTLLRVTGTVVLLMAGAEISAIALWQAMVSLIAAAATIGVVRRFDPRHRLGFHRIEWAVARSRAASGGTLGVGMALSALYWQVPQIVLGMVGGTAWISQYYVAQRFPSMVLLLGGRLANTVLPAAAEHSHPDAAPKLRVVLEASTRWIMLIVVPMCVVLIVAADDVLLAWLGSVDPASRLMLRLGALAVIFDALSAGSMEVLWATGRARAGVIGLAVATAVNFALGWWLLTWLGIAGASWAMVVAVLVGTSSLVGSAAAACAMSPATLLRETFRGMALPILACAGTVHLIVNLMPQAGIWRLAASAMCGSVVYVALLFFAGGRPEERHVVRRVLSALRLAPPAGRS